LKGIDLNQADEYGQHINLGKEVVLLPYADNQNFIVIGVAR
jgi:hypothetical protein